jgi:hypothetical protein
MISEAYSPISYFPKAHTLGGNDKMVLPLLAKVGLIVCFSGAFIICIGMLILFINIVIDILK